MKLTNVLILAALAASFVLPAYTRAATKTVIVLGAGEHVLEVKAGAEELRLVTPSKKHWLIRGLAKGDRIQVSYEQDGEKKVITHVEGRGTVIGTVAKIEKSFITVEADNGARHRLMPRWTGGMPKDGGGHDKSVLEQIHAVEKGQRVQLTWVIEEGKRVTGVKPLARRRE